MNIFEENPEWYKQTSCKYGLPPRCPYAIINICPKYCLSLILEDKREADMRDIKTGDAERLIEQEWTKSDLWIKACEQMPSKGEYFESRDEKRRDLSYFISYDYLCPEAAYLFYGLFVSSISFHKDKEEQCIVDGACGSEYPVRGIVAGHYTDCSIYSVLQAREGRGASLEIVPGSEREIVFKQSPDYASVLIRGKRFTLTSAQARVIQLLHEAYERGTPVMSGNYILEDIERKTSRLRDLFKSSPEAYEELIAKGDKKGTYRLNI